jgi:hypothetical protein
MFEKVVRPWDYHVQIYEMHAWKLIEYGQKSIGLVSSA